MNLNQKQKTKEKTENQDNVSDEKVIEVVTEAGTNSDTTDDSWKSLFASPLNIQPINSSKFIIDFTKIDLILKFQIGESF